MAITINWNKTITTAIVAILTAMGIGSFSAIVGIYIMVSEIREATAVSISEQNRTKNDVALLQAAILQINNTIVIMDKRQDKIEMYYIKPDETRITENEVKKLK